jgi:hypothetical protein
VRIQDLVPTPNHELGLVLWNAMLHHCRRLPDDELREWAQTHPFDQCPDGGNPCPNCAARLVMEERER